MIIGNLVTFIILISFALIIGRVLARRHGAHYYPVFRNLTWYHAVLSLAYYLYAVFNPSDSLEYYRRVLVNYRGDSWGDFYGVSTPFIEFLGYPFVQYLKMPYASVMLVFAWFGLIGFFYFYIFLKERIRFKHDFFGFDLLTIIIFLPNLHFWSASFGKGAVIFLGMALYFFGMGNVGRRFIAVFVGALIIYHVRPHILFIVLVGTAIGFAFTRKGIGLATQIGVVLMACVAFYYIYADVMALIGFDEEEIINEGTQLTRRVKGLTKATSGVDITTYSFPMKMFTFLFRPLFVDSPGTLGIIVSFENLFYLLVFFKLVRLDFFSFLLRSNYMVKAAFISFFGVAAALAQISANLGLAMRQKSQVMLLMMFVILAYLDHKKFELWKAVEFKKLRMERIRKALEKSGDPATSAG